MKVLFTVFISLVFSGILPAQNSNQTVQLQKDTSYYRGEMLYTTTTIRPKVSSGWTGHMKKSIIGTYSFVDGEITVGKDDITQTKHRGFTAFDINGIPDNAIITSIRLTCYTDTKSSSASHTVFVRKLTVDPLQTRGDSLYNNIGNGAILSGTNWKPMILLGYQSTNLNSTALLDLQNSLSQGKYHWSIGFLEDQDDDGWGIFHGWTWGASRIPYCEVEYTVPSYLISVVPSALSFGNVTVGDIVDKTFTITNQSTNSNLYGNISITGSGFNFTSGVDGYNLGPGQSKTVNVRFYPATAGNFSGTVSITHNATNEISPVNIPLSGTGVAKCIIYLNSVILQFGNVEIGQYSEKTFKITNDFNSTQYLSGSILPLSGSFSITSGGENFSIPPGLSKTVTVRFTPESATTFNDTLYILHNGTNTLSPLPLAMSGNGIISTNITAAPDSLNFENVSIGNYSDKVITITNGPNSTAALMGNVSIYGSGFTILSGEGNYNLSPGQNKIITVRFTPSQNGSCSGGVVVTHNAGNCSQNPLMIPLYANALTAIENLEFTGGTPKEYSLYQNYPNPFNPSTRIEFDLPEETVVDISIYDITGALVQNLLHNEVLKTGKYSVKFDAGDLSSGIYLYVYRSVSLLSEKETFFTKKMLLLR